MLLGINSFYEPQVSDVAVFMKIGDKTGPAKVHCRSRPRILRSLLSCRRSSMLTIKVVMNESLYSYTFFSFAHKARSS